MEREKRKRKGTYYRRILLVLTIFMAGVVIPFTGILFKLSEKYTLAGINQSNEHVLAQMKYNFDYISKDIAALCLSVSFQNDTQEIMYSRNPRYDDIYLAVKNLRDTVLPARSSIRSIAIYNANTESWYSTDTDENEINELKDFINHEALIPKLQPILRKISVGTEQIEAYCYVFSYFMYDFSDPTTGKDGFIVVNQNADEFLANLEAGIGEKSVTYIASKTGALYGGGEELEAENRLAKECADRQDTQEQEGFYVQTYGGEKYLVSYIHLEDASNVIVMIQKYQDIFRGMIELRNRFILFCIVYAVLAVAAIVLLAKRIYTPVNELVDYVSTVAGGEDAGELPDENDEIGRLRIVFQKANKLNQKLKNEKHNSRKIVKNYWLRSLLNDSSPERLEEFFKNMPESVLSVYEGNPLAVLCLHLDSYEENRFAFAKEDQELLLDSAGNVMQELLEQAFACETVRESANDLALLVVGKTLEASHETLLDCVRQMQEYMKKHFDVTLCAACEWGAGELCGIAGIYERAKEYGKYRVVYGRGALLGAKECRKNMENPQISYSRELRKKLEESLKLGDKAQTREALLAIRESISQMSYDNVLINCMSLITRINTLLGEISMMKKRTAGLHFDKIYEAALHMEFLEELFEKIGQYIDAVMEDTYQRTEKENDKDEIFVDMVVEFVRENYMDPNLSSQSIAEHIHISASYILKKFKRCAGITLNEYILTVRMKQAAYFLTNTDMPVSRIAESIGIYNENYFYRLFKKVYGCTPREFAAGQAEDADCTIRTL